VTASRRPAPPALCETIPSCLGQAEILCRKIRGWMQGAGLGESCFAVELLARESLVNAVIHGNRCAADKSVRLSLRVGRKWIRLQVADEGEGFDWRKAGQKKPDATTSCGRGLQLYAMYAGRVRFNRKGNRIELWMAKARGR